MKNKPRPTATAICKVCGNEFTAERSKILSGARTLCSKSCRGRLAAFLQTNGGRHPNHGACVGGTTSPLYRRWAAMKARCHSKSSLKFGRYGARGITVCDEWRNSFNSFKEWSLNNGFHQSLQIDRINNDLGYSPENCRWVSCLVNQSNRSNSIIFPSGETTQEVADRLGLTPNAIRSRLKKGMSMEKAMSLPPVPNGNARKDFKLNRWQD